jgi:hypothetical protein
MLFWFIGGLAALSCAVLTVQGASRTPQMQVVRLQNRRHTASKGPRHD